MAWSFYLVLAIAGGIWLASRHDGFPIQWLAPGTWWQELPLGALAGGALLSLWHLGRRVLPHGAELEERLAEVVRGLSGSETFALALLSGFGEELFFRGAVQDTFGLAAATVLFAALHPGPGRTFYLWMIFAALAGALFGALVLWRGNLLAAIVGHVTVNAVNLRQLAERNSATETTHRSDEPSP